MTSPEEPTESGQSDEPGELPFLPPSDAPAVDRDEPPDPREEWSHDGPDTLDPDAPALPPRPDGASMPARVGPPPNPPMPSPADHSAELLDDGAPAAMVRSEPDEEAIEELRAEAKHARTRNNVIAWIVGIILVAGIGVGTYYVYGLFQDDEAEREQQEQPADTQPSSEEMLEELDSDAGG